jgi:integrase
LVATKFREGSIRELTIAKGKRREKGEGSIYLRKSDGKYVAYANLADGKRKYIYADTRGEVSKKLKALQRTIDDKTRVDKSAQSVETYLQSWLLIRGGRIKRITVQGYRTRLKSVYPHIGKIKLQKLTSEDIQGMYNTLSLQGMEASTIKQTHMVLNSALNDAIARKIIAINPAAIVQPRRAQKHEAIILTPEQAKNLLSVIEGQIKTLVTLALATGMRLGEMQSLHWNDINFTDGHVTINKTASYSPDEKGKYSHEETSPKSQSSRRQIALAQFASDELKVHRATQLQARLQAGSKWKDTNLVFCNRTGGYTHQATLERQFYKYLSIADLPHMRFHDLRHSAASMLLQMRVPPKVVQEILGHSSIAITQDLYGHLFPGMQEDAMQKMNGLFGGLQPIFQG